MHAREPDAEFIGTEEVKWKFNIQTDFFLRRTNLSPSAPEWLHLIKISALDCLIRNDAVTRVMTATETLRLITGGNDRNMIVINFVVELSQFRYLVHR